eukprot:gene2377-2842_t
MLEEELVITKETKEIIPDLSTHVLDISNGSPAPGILVNLYKRINNKLVGIGRAITDKDGRIKNWTTNEENQKINVLPGDAKEPGIFALVFETGEYFKRQNQKTIYKTVHVEFEKDDNSHFHIPIVVSPFGYSTYKGS